MASTHYSEACERKMTIPIVLPFYEQLLGKDQYGREMKASSELLGNCRIFVLTEPREQRWIVGRLTNHFLGKIPHGI